jgi:multiple sugar transport system ATP-binding protein
MAQVSLAGIGKLYPGGQRAVEDVNLEIADGELLVLVGPSGCGKSTTLRMIAGLEDISEGTLRIGERVVNDVPARDRNIAMVFQNYALYPHMTVRANLAFGLERRREHKSALRALLSSEYRAKRGAETARIQRHVESAAKTLGLDPLLERVPRELSGGQRQRVAVGRALVRQPQVFLFDEPLSNLDAKLRIEMRAELRDLHRRTGATMVYVTHDQEEAMTLGTRLAVMKDGRVRQCAPPTEIYAQPADQFVASFVGTPTMNFLEGAIEILPAGLGFRVEDGRADGTSSVLPLPRARFALDGVASGTPAVLGVRPDALRPVGESAELRTSESRVQATLDSIDRYGDRMDLRLRMHEVRLVARTAPELDVTEGTRLAVALDLARAHLFARDEAGRTLLAPREPARHGQPA